MHEIDDPVPLCEVRIDYAASPGPGGQNVNKVATKAVLHWPLAASRALTKEQKSRLYSHPLVKNRINSAGEVVLSESRSRSQRINRESALLRLQDLVRRALKPAVKRKRTKPPKRAKEQRLHDKRVQSAKKAARRGKAADESQVV